MTLLVALVVAADQRPDVLVLETGQSIGCAVPADLVITSLSLEHTDVLGGTWKPPPKRRPLLVQ